MRATFDLELPLRRHNRLAHDLPAALSTSAPWVWHALQARLAQIRNELADSAAPPPTRALLRIVVDTDLEVVGVALTPHAPWITWPRIDDDAARAALIEGVRVVQAQARWACAGARRRSDHPDGSPSRPCLGSGS